MKSTARRQYDRHARQEEGNVLDEGNLIVVLGKGSVGSRLVEVVDFSDVGGRHLVDRVSVVVVLLLAGSLRNEDEGEKGRCESAPSGDDESENGSLILVCMGG